MQCPVCKRTAGVDKLYTGLGDNEVEPGRKIGIGYIKVIMSCDCIIYCEGNIDSLLNVPKLSLSDRVTRQLLHGITYSGEQLRIRVTNRFNDDYRERDQWDSIGCITRLLHKKGREDWEGSRRDVHYVHVHSSQDKDKIAKALRDTFTNVGCSCERDCCGCPSQHVRGLKLLGASVWIIKTSITRNL